MKNIVRDTTKAQSAMEYLMTYGWAILIIGVVIGVLYQLGVFSGANFTATACTAAAGYLCTTPIMNTSGYVLVSLGQASSQSITVTGIACSSNQSEPTSFTGVNIVLQPNQQNSTAAAFACPIKNKVIGQSFAGTLWIEYTTPTQSTPLTAEIATFTGVASTSAKLVSSYTDVYCVGGSTSPSNGVYYAKLLGNKLGGGVGGWNSTTPYPVGFVNGGCAIYSGYIYCSPSQGSSDEHIYYASVSSTGVGAWSQGTVIPSLYTMSFAGCTIYQGYIYCSSLCGNPCGSAQTAIISAPINGDGSIGSWSTAGNDAYGLFGDPCFIYQGTMLCLGTYSGTANLDYYATVTSPGQLSSFTATTSYPTSGQPFATSCVVASGMLICAGGRSGNGVYNAVFSPSSGLGASFTSDGSYPGGLTFYQNSCVYDSGYIYCLSSESSPYTQIYYAPVTNGALGSWTLDSNVLYPSQLGGGGSACAINDNTGAYSGGGGSTS